MPSTSFLAPLFAGLLLAYLYPDPPPGECPHDPESCFFSDTYEAARARFREASRAAGARLHTLPLDNATLGDLTVDVAIFDAAAAAGGGLYGSLFSARPAADPPTLLHISGTHGVEAHAGSAVQLALLERWRASGPPEGVRVVLVHALNPFGFKFGRRWNEDGIDLNRNCLPEEAFPGAFAELAETGGRGAGIYRKFSGAFNWDAAWRPLVDDVTLWSRFARTLALNSFVDAKRAIVSGQYFDPQGLYFGGQRLASSYRVLLELLRAECASASASAVVDVHTGLGPSGVDSLMTSVDASDAVAAERAEAAARVFGSPSWGEADKDFIVERAGNADASSGYELAIGSSANIVRALPGWSRALHVTQEFGTRPGLLVLRGMILERAEWLHNGGSRRGAAAARGVFYVKTATWQRKVVRRGVEVASQALAALARATDAEGASVFPPNPAAAAR